MTTDSITQSAIATSRFGFGARPGELAAVAADPRGWLLTQVRAPYRASAELDGLTPGREILATFLAARSGRAEARKQRNASVGAFRRARPAARACWSRAHGVPPGRCGTRAGRDAPTWRCRWLPIR